jgi:hypothetical protein
MRSRDPRGARCRLRPILEGLEGRELPSALVASSPAVGRAGSHPAAAIVAQPDSPNGLLGKSAPGPFLDPAILQRVAAALYPASAAPGAPTPDEVRRQTFTARWVGKYTIGPPRFSDRASTIHLYGVSGGSDQFLKGKFDIAIFPPADPAATPTPGNPFANQITGFAALFGQSYLQSGAMLVLDLNGTPRAGTPPEALPSQLSWAYDNNSSGGPYASPGGVVPGSGFTQGAGVMQLQWKPDPHPPPGTSGSGRVVITFQGLINTSQIVSGVSKFIS